MDLYSVRVAKHAHALAALAIIAMHDSVDDGLSQSLQRILRYINALKTFDPGSHRNIAAQEQFRPVDQILECSCDKPTIRVSTGAERLTIQNTGHVALHDILLRGIAEEQHPCIRRN